MNAVQNAAHEYAAALNTEILTAPDIAKLMPSVHRISRCTWSPGAVAKPALMPGVVRFLLMQEGILACQNGATTARILPHEILRIDGSQQACLQNLSRSDPLYAIEIILLKQDPDVHANFHHRYFPDDQKDNKLCLVASPRSPGQVLNSHAAVEIFLTALKPYDSVVLESHHDNALAVMAVSGAARINDEAIDTTNGVHVCHQSALTISTVSAAVVLSLRQLDTTGQ